MTSTGTERHRVFARGRKRPAPYAMNKGKAAYAFELEMKRHAGAIEWWRFQAITLKLAERSFFTADFFVMLPDGTFELHHVQSTMARTQKSGRVERPSIKEDVNRQLKNLADMYPLRVCVAFRTKDRGWVTEVL